MTDETILKKLESIARCVERITTHRPAGADALRVDHDAQDIISVNLQRAVQLAVDAGGIILSRLGSDSPATMADTFAKLAGSGVITAELAGRLARAVGFRNISVHEYDEIDWNIVFSIVSRHLGDFRSFAAAIRRHIGNPGARG